MPSEIASAQYTSQVYPWPRQLHGTQREQDQHPQHPMQVPGGLAGGRQGRLGEQMD
jgi:hypothetical protein